MVFDLESLKTLLNGISAAIDSRSVDQSEIVKMVASLVDTELLKIIGEVS